MQRRDHCEQQRQRQQEPDQNRWYPQIQQNQRRHGESHLLWKTGLDDAQAGKRQKTRKQERRDQNEQGINQQTLEPRPRRIHALVIIRQQHQHARQIISSDAHLQGLHIKFRQLARGERLLERHAVAQVGFEQLDLRAQRALAHVLGELTQRAFKRNALAQHRRELLVEEGELVVFHRPKILSYSASLVTPWRNSSRAEFSRD